MSVSVVQYHEKRAATRQDIVRPCKVFDPRRGRYVSGITCNLSTDGALLLLDELVTLERGDRLYVGIAMKRRQALLLSNEMIESDVMRAAALEAGVTRVAVRFVVPCELEVSPAADAMRAAA
jgi:hypothetical protein